MESGTGKRRHDKRSIAGRLVGWNYWNGAGAIPFFVGIGFTKGRRDGFEGSRLHDGAQTRGGGRRWLLWPLGGTLKQEPGGDGTSQAVRQFPSRGSWSARVGDHGSAANRVPKHYNKITLAATLTKLKPEWLDALGREEADHHSHASCRASSRLKTLLHRVIGSLWPALPVITSRIRVRRSA